MMKLEQIREGLTITLKDTGECLHIRKVMPYMLDTVLIEYEDQNGTFQERILGAFDEPNLALVEAQSESASSNQIHPLLPTVPGEAGARQLQAYEKKEISQQLGRNGFELSYDREAGISDWIKDGTIYRVFHGSGRTGRIYLLDPKPDPQPTPQSQHEAHRDPSTKTRAPERKTNSPPSDIHLDESPSKASKSGGQLAVGMYVRLGTDEQYRLARNHREYHIGQIKKVDNLSHMVHVRILKQSPYAGIREEFVERDWDEVRRCALLPETEGIDIPTRKDATILLAVSEGFIEGQLQAYYVAIEDRVVTRTEAELLVASHSQDPYPFDQHLQYEFQHPSFFFQRNQLVEALATLRSNAFGIEELVGSRVQLLAHQAEVISTVLGDDVCRFVLADEVGLGKTIEACVIMKGLRRRQPKMKTLIVSPTSLLHQWYNELDRKFWLRFPVYDWRGSAKIEADDPGLLVSSEQIEERGDLVLRLLSQEWDLLIVDEAHHIHKNRLLYERLVKLSAGSRRVLVLSATPIQKRAEEYLALLTLVLPERYSSVDRRQFQQMLRAQARLRTTINYLAQDLTPEYFMVDEFVEEMNQVVAELSDDLLLAELVNRVKESGNLDHALEAISYVSENYRIENRVLRNRRRGLTIQLPERQLVERYGYTAEKEEELVLDALYSYLDDLVRRATTRRKAAALELTRIFLNAAFSSPQALHGLLAQREKALSLRGADPWQSDILTPSGLRSEPARIRKLMGAVPRMVDEARRINQLIWLVEQWQEKSDLALESQTIPFAQVRQNYRLARVLQAVDDLLRSKPAAKILIFSGWLETLLALKPHLVTQLRRRRSQVAEFHRGIADAELQENADHFQADERYGVILCDELGGEGRNFQNADLIIHVDLPWTPAQLEQRIGRVDRLGRTGVVSSVVPYVREQVEHDLFRIWQEGFSLFTQSMSGLEIALEEVLDQLRAALEKDVRSGLEHLIPIMKSKARDLRDAIEEERYFEERAINIRRRSDFQRISERYRDGSELGRAVVKWANHAGLRCSYRPQMDTVRFFPRQFSIPALENAKYVAPPNMIEALERSGVEHTLHITGTFNRDIAVQREDLVFFAPGEQWTDSILDNALQADRGRACAILRPSFDMKEEWRGFELFYQILVDPRPLYEQGFLPIHLLAANEYVAISTQRLLVTVEGEVITKSSHPAWQAINARPFDKSMDIHLGTRGNGGAQTPLAIFKETYPRDMWQEIIQSAELAAKAWLEEQFVFADEADEAAEAFRTKAMGLKASYHWQRRMRQAEDRELLARIRQREKIGVALEQGIHKPLWRLEAACFWIITPKD